MKMKKFVILSLFFALGLPSVMADVFDEDDIYYNPKKEKTAEKKKKQSYYIKDFQDMDVDEYNRRGQYYASPVDTIGYAVENGEDFVYTQQIQKFYNPTIVVDNAELLADVLDNSYGNVEVVYDFSGVPSFVSPYLYGWPYSYPSWSRDWLFCPYWSIAWGPSVGWGPTWSWWGPAWGWSPYSTWGPSYGWSWGFSYGWGPTYGWGWRPGWNRPSPGYIAHHYRPGGNRPAGPGHNWASSTRPGGGNWSAPHRGSASNNGYSRPVNGNGQGSMATPNAGPNRNTGNYHRGSNRGGSGVTDSPANRRGGTTTGQDGRGLQLRVNETMRQVTSTMTNNSSYTTNNRNTTTTNIRNTTTTTTRRNSGSNYGNSNTNTNNSHRSSGSSVGSSSRGGGGGGSTMRSGGSRSGGGSRGGGGRHR